MRFQASASLNRQGDAVWLSDELTPGRFAKFDAQAFNKITEGDAHLYVPVKKKTVGEKKKKLRWTHHLDEQLQH